VALDAIRLDDSFNPGVVSQSYRRDLGEIGFESTPGSLGRSGDRYFPGKSLIESHREISTPGFFARVAKPILVIDRSAVHNRSG
jgi:hypothetical protein